VAWALPSKAIPAGELEQYVVDQIRRIGLDPTAKLFTWERGAG
jgi:hypothetical protein